MSDEHLATLTHVRLRAAQGDVSAAKRMLRAILDEHPDYLPALRLLERLASRDPSETPLSNGPGAAAFAGNEDAESLPPPQPGDPSRLASHFRRELGAPSSTRERIRRLESWLDRLMRRPQSGC